MAYQTGCLQDRGRHNTCAQDECYCFCGETSKGKVLPGAPHTFAAWEAKLADGRLELVKTACLH